MLCDINIKDYTIVKQLSLTIESGMTVITGETGAGKSIIIDAIEIALGGRTNAKIIRPGCDRCDISVCFDVRTNQKALHWLQQNDLDSDAECLLRRVIHKDGRSRCYINGSQSPLQSVKELSQHLISIHGQHQHQALLKKDYQRILVDNYANNQSSLNQLNTHYQAWSQLQKQIQQLTQHANQRDSRIAFLEYQVNELNELNLQPGELDSLHANQQQLANADHIILLSQQALAGLSEEELSASSQVNRMMQVLQQLQQYDDSMQENITMLSQALINIDEVAANIRHAVDNLEQDPQQLQQVEQRLSLIHQLSRKHNCQPEQLMALQQQFQQELNELLDFDSNLENLQQTLSQARDDYLQVAKKLTTKRKKAAQALSKTVTQAMQTMGMQGGVFTIELNKLDAEQLTAHGLDDVAFCVSTNPGMPSQALGKVASGGELSRLSLAIQVTTTKTTAVPAMIFDEVDVGIGGQTAAIVGKLLRQLAQQSQLLCITHLPQVASQGHHHLHVKKVASDNATQSDITFLSNAEKITEIARMVGGEDLTQQSIAHAEQLLSTVES